MAHNPDDSLGAKLEPWRCHCGDLNSEGASYCTACAAPRGNVDEFPPNEMDVDPDDIIVTPYPYAEAESLGKNQVAGTLLGDLWTCPKCEAGSRGPVCPRCGFRLYAHNIRLSQPVQLPSPWPRRRALIALIALWIIAISGAILVVRASL